MNRPPYFPFYPKDWEDWKVQRMGYEAQGVYMRLLCFMWKDSKDQCSILDSDKLIAKSLGLSIRKWQVVKTEIQQNGDPLLKKRRKKLVSLRLQNEAKKLQNFRKMQSEKGKKSAESRFLRRTAVPTTVEPRHQPQGNLSSSLSPSNKHKNNTEEPKGSPACPKSEPSDADTGLVKRLVNRILENNPKARIPKNLDGWLNACRLMREQDNRTPGEIDAMIQFSQNDQFWRSNILSMPKLREKFDQLWLKARRTRYDGIAAFVRGMEEKNGRD